jgi:hypothetical protein
VAALAVVWVVGVVATGAGATVEVWVVVVAAEAVVGVG